MSWEATGTSELHPQHRHRNQVEHEGDGGEHDYANDALQFSEIPRRGPQHDREDPRQHDGRQNVPPERRDVPYTERRKRNQEEWPEHRRRRRRKLVQVDPVRAASDVLGEGEVDVRIVHRQRESPFSQGQRVRQAPAETYQVDGDGDPEADTPPGGAIEGRGWGVRQMNAPIRLSSLPP